MSKNKKIVAAVKDYLSGETAADVAEKYLVTTSTVLNWVRKAGYTARHSTRTVVDWEFVKKELRK